MAREAEIETYPESDIAPGCLHPRYTYELIGHGEAESRFINAKKSGRLHHAWLISGAPGIGKATLAYRMIRYILGGQPLLEGSLDIPASDPVSKRIESLGHGNFMLLRRPYDFKLKRLRTEIPVDDIREMGKFFQGTASEDRSWRVCLVDSADDLNKNSENAILKILEEPPVKTIIILLSSAPGRLLPTIRSRCMHLPLREVPEAEIKPWLRTRLENDGTSVSDDILDAAVKLSRGGPGKAFALARNADTVLTPLTQLIAGLGRGNSTLDHRLATHFSAKSMQAERELFWEALQDVLQAQTRFSVTGEWIGAFKPLPITKTASQWHGLWEKSGEMQIVSNALNMDMKTVLYDMFAGMRAA